MAPLSPASLERYFDIWIRQKGWDSFHPSDMERFYRFVKAAARHRRRYKRAPTRGAIRARILERQKNALDDSDLSEAAEEFAELYQTFMNYEKVRLPGRDR
jgi:hypothetical protein